MSTEAIVPKCYLEIESERTRNLFYGFLFDVTCRLNIFNNVINLIKSTFSKQKYDVSQRLQFIMNKLQHEQDAIIQHGVVFYGICYNQDVRNFIICHYDAGEPRQTVMQFISKFIEPKTQQLLDGKYRSFTEYVEDLRYLILLEMGI